MKTTLAAFAAIGALMLAAPASAHEARDHDRGHAHQSYGGGVNFSEQLDRLQRRVYMGAQRGDLNRWEARRFSADIRAIDDLRRYYRRSDGLSPREARDLDRRIDALRYAINSEIRDDRYAERGYDGRGYGQGPRGDDRRDDGHDGGARGDRDWNR